MRGIQIVAEIGCNHNGSVELAKKMIKEAKEAGVDTVKFQSFVHLRQNIREKMMVTVLN